LEKERQKTSLLKKRKTKNLFTWKKKDKNTCLLGKRKIKNQFTWKKKDKKPVYLNKERQETCLLSKESC
jgi:hypothetical protein